MASNRVPQSRNVIAAFTIESKLRDRRLTIPRRGRIIEQVSALLTTEENLALIGVKDSTGNTWID